MRRDGLAYLRSVPASRRGSAETGSRPFRPPLRSAGTDRFAISLRQDTVRLGSDIAFA